MPKPKTKAQLDRATDIRLQKTYGVTLDWYCEQLARQNGVCAITGSPPGSRRLHVDHDHSWTKVKVDTIKVFEAWESAGVYNGRVYHGSGRTKSEAIKRVKVQLKRASVRGLLSYSANAGLQKFQDNPKFLRAAAQYLENHQEAA